MVLQRPHGNTLLDYESDDGSTSSTVTVRVSLKQQVEEKEAQDEPQASKKVSFCLAQNSNYGNDDLYKEDTKELWYTAHDYKSFRIKALYMAKEIHRTELANKAPFSYGRCMTRAYEACCEAAYQQCGNILTSDERKHLVRWAEVATSRLGLEKWSISTVVDDKSYRRTVLVELVKEIQNSSYSNPVAKAEYMRECSERVTKPSQLFARTLAEAQGAASQKAAPEIVGALAQRTTTSTTHVATS